MITTMHTRSTTVLGMWAAMAAVACSNEKSSQTIEGVASAGPVVGGKVEAYAIDANGQIGAALGTCTTGQDGNFTLTIDAAAGPVELRVTGGYYAEEGNGAFVGLSAPMRLQLADSPNTAVGITPLTEIAAARAGAMVAADGNVRAAILNATYAVGAAAGIPNITLPPANPNRPMANPNDQASRYALFLAGISRYAADNHQTSVSMMVGLAHDFRRDGVFDGHDAGNAVVVDANVVLATNGNNTVSTQVGVQVAPPPGSFTLAGDSWTRGIPQGAAAFAGSASGRAAGFSGQSSVAANSQPPLTAPPGYRPPPPPSDSGSTSSASGSSTTGGSGSTSPRP